MNIEKSTKLTNFKRLKLEIQVKDALIKKLVAFITEKKITLPKDLFKIIMELYPIPKDIKDDKKTV